MLILDFRTGKMTKIALDFSDAASALISAGLLGLGGAGLGYLIDMRAGTGKRWTKILGLLGLLGGLGLGAYGRYLYKTDQTSPNQDGMAASPLAVSGSTSDTAPEEQARRLPADGSPLSIAPTSDKVQSDAPSAKTRPTRPSSGSSDAPRTSSGSSRSPSNQQQPSVSISSSAGSAGTKLPPSPPAVQHPQGLHSESSNRAQSPSASSGQASGTPQTSSKSAPGSSGTAQSSLGSSGRPSAAPPTSPGSSSGPSDQKQTSGSTGSSAGSSGTKPSSTGIRLSDDLAQRLVERVKTFLKDTRGSPDDTDRYKDLDQAPNEMCVRLVHTGVQGGQGVYQPDARAYRAAAEFARGDEQKQRAIRLAKRFSARIHLLLLLQPKLAPDMAQDITQRINDALTVLLTLKPDASNADEIDKYFADRLRGLFSNDIINKALTDPFSISPEPR